MSPLFKLEIRWELGL